jgi:hypothetical protein
VASSSICCIIPWLPCRYNPFAVENREVFHLLPMLRARVTNRFYIGWLYPIFNSLDFFFWWYWFIPKSIKNILLFYNVRTYAYDFGSFMGLNIIGTGHSGYTWLLFDNRLYN